jgi:hypothetical protein
VGHLSVDLGGAVPLECVERLEGGGDYDPAPFTEAGALMDELLEREGVS